MREQVKFRYLGKYLGILINCQEKLIKNIFKAKFNMKYLKTSTPLNKIFNKFSYIYLNAKH